MSSFNNLQRPTLDITRTNYIDKCLFSYISNAIFLIGIAFFLYFFLDDLKDRLKKPTIKQDEHEYIRPQYKMNWIYAFFIMLLLGFFISSYMCKVNS